MMRTIVRFSTPTGDFAIPVEHVTEVRPAAELRALPAAGPGVAGVMRRGGEALTVLSVLGEPGRHVIVIDDEAVMFGLLVGEVTGVHRVDDAVIGPPPRGQDGGTVAGVIVEGGIEGGGVVLLLDTAALRARLSG